MQVAVQAISEFQNTLVTAISWVLEETEKMKMGVSLIWPPSNLCVESALTLADNAVTI